MTVYLPPALADALKIHAIEKGREASEIVEEALGEYLRRD